MMKTSIAVATMERTHEIVFSELAFTDKRGGSTSRSQIAE